MPIQIGREKVEKLTDFIFLVLKTHRDDDCGMKYRGLGDDRSRQNAEVQRQHIDKKGIYSSGCVLLVVTHACENWTIRKAEGRKMAIFEFCAG